MKILIVSIVLLLVIIVGYMYTNFDSNYKVEIYDDVLTLSECNQVINAAKKRGLHPSEAFDASTGKDDPTDDYRKSKTIFLEDGDLSPNLSQKFINIAKQFVPDAKLNEQLQVVHYEPGDYFKSHLDASDYLLDNIENEDVAKCTGRRYTLLFYLNNVKEGGETRFVNINQTVEPKAGRVAFWSNLGSDNRPVPESEHEGRPPKSGDKWIINYWIH
jgi:hypothetical protein